MGSQFRIPLSALLACSAAGSALAAGPQATGSVQDGMNVVQEIPGARPAETETKSDLLIVPIPQSSPSLGTGLTLGAGLFYNPNGSKEQSTTGGAVMATSNGSWALGAGHKMFWGEDRFKLTAFAGYGDVNLRF